MPLNPNIPLSVQGLDIGKVYESYLKGQDIAQKREANQIAIDAAKRKVEEEESDRRLGSIARFSQGTLIPLLEKGDVQGAKQALSERVVQLGKRGVQSDDTGEGIVLVDKDPDKLLNIAKQSVQLAEQRGVLKTPKGKSVSAMKGETIIPAIENEKGQLVDPMTGKQLEGYRKVPSKTGTVEKTETGAPGSFSSTTRTKGDIEESIVKSAEGIARLESISKAFKPEYLELGSKFSALIGSQKEKLGVTLTEKERKQLTDFSTFKRKAVNNINLYIKEITGAAMSIQEAERLTKGMPNAGTGLFDGDSATEFKAKMDDTIEELKASKRRLIHLRKNGLTGELTNEIAEKFPLSDFKVSPNTKILQEAQDAINRGADREKVKGRLKELGIDPAELK